MNELKMVTLLFLLLCICTVISVLFGIAEVLVMIFTPYDSLEEWCRARRIKKKRKKTERLLNDIRTMKLRELQLNLDCESKEEKEE